MQLKKRKTCFIFAICILLISFQAKADDNYPFQSWREPLTGMEFVRIPEGGFEMGSQFGERGRFPNEGPVHRVQVQGFWMGKYEVTNAQYRQFNRDHYSGTYKNYSLNDDKQPVVYVRWYDTKAFAKWLTDQNNGRYRFRLPTETEWEYACRAGTKTARYWGNDSNIACNYANAYDETAKKTISLEGWQVHKCDDSYAVTANVGSFQPNNFGLYDMLGNVEEWCEDIYSDDAYRKHSRSGSKRVVRGGSWYFGPRYARCAFRSYESPDTRNLIMGFRLVMEK